MPATLAAPSNSSAAEPAAASCPGCGAPLRGRELLRSHDRLMGGPGDFAVLACQSCGLASTQPRLRAEQFADYYPEVYYPERAERAGRLGGLVERARLEAIVRFGPYRPLYRRAPAPNDARAAREGTRTGPRQARVAPGRLLDVGCGSGALAATFARHGWSVAGVEPSAQAAARARAAGVEAHTGTLDDAPWRGPTFDAIVFNHSLEHVPDPLASLRQAAALLRDGGTLAVAVPNFGCWQRRLFGPRWFQLDLPRHLQHFESRTLVDMFVRVGLHPTARTTASMRPALLLSLQYAAFGRARWSGRGLRLAAWAIAPALWALDRVLPGDCLHLFATRAEDPCAP
ncbi:MAG TPA: class I SAM-dependent methyltransferase [Solirubrobacteraceae bacterium]|jgi:2-polyprenyl-3-methyl-5-hydroxy-6-metoxy-1,4-benzoquinol methylase|nr:class I SAM-dependent methyltransferase [Solirubrobacteraceae bacterium]